MVKNPLNYKWSSCLDYFKPPNRQRYGLTPEIVLSLLGNKQEEQLISYKTLLSENSGIELPPVHRSVGYGDCDLIQLMDHYLEKNPVNIESSKVTRNQINPEKLIKLILQITNTKVNDLKQTKRNNIPRQLACFVLRKYTQLTLKETGEYLNMSYHSVSNTARLFEKKLKHDQEYICLWTKIQQEINRG